jgi:hypothetical protein
MLSKKEMELGYNYKEFKGSYWSLVDSTRIHRKILIGVKKSVQKKLRKSMGN